MEYRQRHATALALMEERNAPEVVFTVTSGGGYNPKTDKTEEPVSTTVTGRAVEVPGEPEEYEQNELIGKQPITLLFVPFTFGEEPPIGSQVQWSGKLRTVQGMVPIRPDGTLIAARVLLT